MTILIGRNNSGGTTGKSGVLIGLEVVCHTTPEKGDIAAFMTHLIMHEYGHVQQYPDGGEDAQPGTVLSQSLIEGEGEPTAELTTGHISNTQLLAWTKGRERAIDEAFVADMDKTDLAKPGSTTGAARPRSRATSATGSAGGSRRPTT